MCPCVWLSCCSPIYLVCFARTATYETRCRCCGLVVHEIPLKQQLSQCLGSRSTILLDELVVARWHEVRFVDVSTVVLAQHANCIADAVARHQRKVRRKGRQIIGRDRAVGESFRDLADHRGASYPPTNHHADNNRDMDEESFAITNGDGRVLKPRAPSLICSADHWNKCTVASGDLPNTRVATARSSSSVISFPTHENENSDEDLSRIHTRAIGQQPRMSVLAQIPALTLSLSLVREEHDLEQLICHAGDALGIDLDDRELLTGAS